MLLRLGFPLILLIFGVEAKSQTLGEQTALALKVLNEHHYSPRKIDEQFASDLKTEFFSIIDPLGLYFTKKDLESDSIQLFTAAFENKLLLNDWGNKVKARYRWRLKVASKIILNALAKPISVNENEFGDPFLLRNGERCNDADELSKKWNRWLKQEVMMTMHDMAEETQDPINSKQLLAFEPLARTKVREEELKKIERSLNSLDNPQIGIYESFLKSIAKTFDPHSDYFSSKEKEVFEADLSPTEASFGFEVDENGWGAFSVIRVIPGSPAWNSNELHKGDILLQIKKPKGNFADVGDFDKSPSKLLKEWSENEIELKLKKADGSVVIVKLLKEKIESTENRVQGFVLNGAKKIGYVALPSFYQEWDDENESNAGCANNLAKEIIKQKKEGIHGLILDLRFNGGGSVLEAMEIVGIFIDIGPVSVISVKGQPPVSLKDLNRGSVYDGPLIVMVNGASASASEFVAAALQDYNRALIVGTPTYGKATGQKIFPMTEKNDEFLKITDVKLYRITGKSNQGKGVIPDIKIPDLTDDFVLKEKLMRHSLPQDSIVKKTYYTPSPKTDLLKIKLASKERTEKNQQFLKLDSIREFYRKPIPLKIDAFVEYLASLDQLGKAMSRGSVSPNFKVTPTQFDNSLLTIDTFRKSISDEAKEQIAKSPYIDEAFSIMTDYINKTTKR